MRHTKLDLKQMQSLPLEAKIRMSNTRINGWIETFDTFISLSGGKDSSVLLDLVRRQQKDIVAVHVRTGLEYPEVTDHALSYDNVTILKPIMDHKTVITNFGYPAVSKDVSKIIWGARHSQDKSQNYLNRLNGLATDGSYDNYKQQYKKYKFLLNAPFEISNRCCYYMKEKPLIDYENMTGKKTFIGTLATESKQRLDGWLKTGCNAFDSDRPISKPISFWSEQDILRYIKINNLKIADVYGEIIPKDGQLAISEEMTTYETSGCDRTGCMFCMYGCHLEKGEGRFQRLKRTHPNIYDYVMRGGKFNQKGMWVPFNGLGYKFVIDWLNDNGKLNIKY